MAPMSVFAVSRGRRRVGWGAIASGALGIGLGALATRSSVGNLEVVFNASLVASMLVFATPLTYAALGGIFSERSGVVNIGLEGMMLMGAFWGIWGADKTGSWFWGVVIGAASGGLLALVHAFFAITLRAEDAIAYCDKFSLDDMPEDVLNLMRLLYSMIAVSFPVECWKQPRVPDSGASTLDCIAEPFP